MTDDKKTPGPDDTSPPSGTDGREEAVEPTQEAAAGEKPAETAAAKPKLSEEEKAAKVAAAKAKAAARKAAAGGEAAAAPTAASEPAEPKPPWEEKPVPPEHADAADDPEVQGLAAALPDVVVAADRYAGQLTITVPAARIVEVCRHLKGESGYRFLVDLTAVDWPERADGRFDVLYWLHRHADSARLRLRAVLAEGQGIASVSGVWRTANWLEREVYDMFGIIFEGHPGLERILTWEGFNGHPLRKDFPVEGIDTGAAIYPDVYPPGGGPATAADGEEGSA